MCSSDLDTDDQSLSLNTTNNQLTLDGGTTTIDLSIYENTDEQGISLAGDVLSISGSTTTVDLSLYLDNTDTQGLTLSTNDILGITGNTTTIDLGNYADGDGIYSGSGIVPSSTNVTITDNLNFDNSTLYIDGSNNRLGIGTAAPSATLHLSSTIAEMAKFETNNGSQAMVKFNSMSPGVPIGLAFALEDNNQVFTYVAPADTTYQVQVKGNIPLTVDKDSITIDNKLTVTNLYVGGINVSVGGGSAGAVLTDNGSGQAIWQMPNTTDACPLNMNAVNSHYCIDDNDKGASTLNFWQAASDCMSQDKRLCTMTEWYFACQQNKMTNTLTNFEWVDFGGSNNSHIIKDTGTNCSTTSTSTSAFGTPQEYRCCFSR